MKPTDPIGDDKKLHALLNSWKADASLPPRIEENVWRRIGQSEAQTPKPISQRIANWLESLLPRPRVAAALSVLLLLGGLATGLRQGERTAARHHVELSARYLQSVDPYLATDR
jgi:hypothetical protein